MTDNVLRSEHAIQLIRKGGECIASIPDLCISEKGATPQEALLAALEAEAVVREAIETQGIHLPLPGNRIDPLPQVTRFAQRHFPFIAKIAAGYVLVVCMTAILLALVIPSIRLRAQQYVTSHDIAADVGRILSRIGVAVCLEKS